MGRRAFQADNSKDPGLETLETCMDWTLVSKNIVDVTWLELSDPALFFPVTLNTI